MNYNILIVEDANLISLHLQKILENAGYTDVNVASNKAKALECIEDKTPDIIIMDIMLAGDDDGIETMKEIQKSHDIPVIYLTALTDRSTIERAKDTRPYGYIMKPFQAEQVVTLLEMALHKYSSESKLRESEKKFKAAVSAMSDSFVFLNQEFKISYINKAAENITGFSLDECFDKNFYDVITLYNLETGEEEINLWKGGPEAQTLDLEPMLLVNKSGQKVHIGDGVISKVYDHKEQLKGVVITFRDITASLEERKLKEELNKRQLAGMIEGQEHEKSRIARDLHDGLGQVLNAIKLELRRNNVDQSLKDLIDEAIQEISRISENLLPSKLKNFDLATCLFSLVSKDIPELKVSFEATDIDNGKVSLNKKINLYRITQELISNCVKHAEAKNLSIQLHGEESTVVLTVEDDGKGFDFSKQKDKLLKGHMGLQNIIDRVKIMNGKLEVDSKKKLGSLIIVEVPYDK